MAKTQLTKFDDMVGLTVTEVRVVHRGEEVIVFFADESFILLVTEHYGGDRDDVCIAVEDFSPAAGRALRYAVKQAQEKE